ncbi:hypothetical protein L596_029937 [Steinernema carpocapsae]|uniref:G protein gamma domain-containing protein n=1 Tax=Steinernema carpocapsae TaxID=34508 RepID=A0A4U5LR91_STECR|nr:hypothetical protein L596_029937 [Steinernema carpocapsae]
MGDSDENKDLTIAKLKVYRKELEHHAQMDRTLTSTACNDLLAYMEKNKGDDFLVTRNGWNPFTDPGGSWWLCK